MMLFPSFGVDPADSAALQRLRQTIDAVGFWPSPAAREAGDYEAAVVFMAEIIALHRQLLQVSGPGAPASEASEGGAPRLGKITSSVSVPGGEGSGE